MMMWRCVDGMEYEKCFLGAGGEVGLASVGWLLLLAQRDGGSGDVL